MYIDYSTWENFEYSLNTLKLDLNNPRINYYGTPLNQTQIMEYLIKNEKVYELAKKISDEGYFVGEEPIICIEDNKKIVLEGNRRTAALKLLQDPKKYLPTSRANTLLKNIHKNNFAINSKLKCYIAPNRLLANPIIYSRHKGEALKKWETGNQYTFVSDMYYKDGLSLDDICLLLNETQGNIKKILKAYNLFDEAQKIYLEKTGEFIEISNFDITNLERFYNYEPAKEFLGIIFSDDDASLEINISNEEFEKRLLYIFSDLLNNSGFSREFNIEEQKQKYLTELKQNPLFNLTISSSETTKKCQATANKKKLDEEKSKITTRRKNRTPIKNDDDLLFGGKLILRSGKVNELYRAIESIYINSKKKEIVLPIIGMSLRLILEVTARLYFEEKGSEIKNKDQILSDFIKVARTEMSLQQPLVNYFSMTNDWLNKSVSLDGMLGKYAHGNIIIEKSNILAISKIVGQILEFYQGT